MAKYEDATRFPNGVAQIAVMVAGGTAGDHTVDEADVGDAVVNVQRVTFDASAVITSTTDLTTEFESPVEEDGKINNSGGTNSTDAVLLITLAKGRDNTD